jgi:hypothetical protein
VSDRGRVRRARLGVGALSALLGLLLLCPAVLPGCRGEKGGRGKNEPRPEEKLGAIEVTSDPTEAAVFLDGDHRVGKTPLLLSLPVGTRHEILLVKSGYENHRLFVLVEGPARRRVSSVLERNHGVFVITAGPIRGARILLDGVFVGTTPDRIRALAEDEHRVDVWKAGFLPYSTKVRVQPSEEKTVTAFLAPLGKSLDRLAWITVKTPSALLQRGHALPYVFLDTTSLGPPPFEVEIPVTVGAHRLRVVMRPGSAPVEIPFSVRAKEKKTLTLPENSP